MKKYLFFCFGNFSKTKLDNILNQVSKNSDKDKMIYQSGDNYIVIHLFSNNSLTYLRNNFAESLSSMTNCQFLFEDDTYYDNMIESIKNTFGINNQEQSLTDYFIMEVAKDKIDRTLEMIDELNQEFDEIFPDENKDEEIKEDYNFIKKLDTVIRDFINNEDENIMETEDCYVDDDEDTLINKTVKKEYSVDEILDKIGEKGLSSLTKEELNFLNSFSK